MKYSVTHYRGFEIRVAEWPGHISFVFRHVPYQHAREVYQAIDRMLGDYRAAAGDTSLIALSKKYGAEYCTHDQKRVYCTVCKER